MRPQHHRFWHIAIQLPCWLLSATASPAEFHVDATAGADSNDGLTWATAKATINSAIDAAGATPEADTVLVATGVYRQSLTLISNLTLEGGYPAGGGPRDLALQPTTLEMAGPAAPVLTIVGADAVAVDGFTIRYGQGRWDASWERRVGGGIYSDGSKVTLSNLVVRNNYVRSFCNATYNLSTGGCDVEVQAAPEGAGLYATSSEICLTNSLFVNNRASYAAYWDRFECANACERTPSWPTEGATIHAWPFGGLFSMFYTTVADNLCDAEGAYDYRCTSGVTASGSGTFWSGSNILWGFAGSAFPRGVDYDLLSPDFGHSIVGTGNTNGPGTLSQDPLFVTGPGGGYYLSQVAAGQSLDSPGLDAGGAPVSWLNMDRYTTSTAEVEDAGTADIGYHHPIPIRPVLFATKRPGGGPTFKYLPAGGGPIDLIRGLVSNLVDTGTYIDLGPVECVADDDTTGEVNDTLIPSEPPPGEVFFYLIGEASRGMKYGATAGKELRPASGDCP